MFPSATEPNSSSINMLQPGHLGGRHHPRGGRRDLKMFNYVESKLQHSYANGSVIDTGGVGQALLQLLFYARGDIITSERKPGVGWLRRDF